MTNERYRVLKTWSDALLLVISDHSLQKYCGCINVFTLLGILRRYLYSLRVKRNNCKKNSIKHENEM